jgi:ribosomal subunit interface protein
MSTAARAQRIANTGSESAIAGPDIVVRGRHTEVTDRFRRHVEGKIAGLDRLDHKLFRLDVEISEERNPRLADSCDRVEITAYSRGPVIRAEASGPDFYAALDLATAKLEERLRRAADRRHSRGSRVAAAHAVEARLRTVPSPQSPDGTDTVTGGAEEDEGPFVVRVKDHSAAPMTLDEALSQMELVGHDFYLFECVDTGCPSVVYRRRGYHYGVVRLRSTKHRAQAEGDQQMSDISGSPSR